jgi:hypothetical protein
MSNIINLNIGMKGFFRLLSYNPRTGVETPLTDWHENSMLLSGMNLMGQRLGLEHNGWAGLGSKCQVGTVSVPEPSTDDTQLLGYIAGTDVIVDHTSGAQPSEPFYGWDRTTYEFNPDDHPEIGEQNLQEGGVGWATADNPPALITRALFTDGIGGNPTFTPLDDEIMRVQYELRYYPPLTDTIGAVTLNGVLYDTVSRASNVASWGGDIGSAMGVLTGSVVPWIAYEGILGTIEQAPSGLSAQADNTDQLNLGYSNNSFERDMQIDIGPTGFNLAGGIRSIWIATNAGFFQTQFGEDPGALGNTIPKDVNFTMSFTWRLGWGEKIL